MLENVGYITELIANYCYKSLGHTGFWASWCEFVHGSLFNLQRNVLL